MPIALGPQITSMSPTNFCFIFCRNSGETKYIILTVVSGCTLAILGALLMVFLLQVKEKRRISYAKLSQFKVQFRRRSAFNSNGNLDNPIYRDNPTTRVI